MSPLFNLALLALCVYGQNIINSEWIDLPFGVYLNTYPGGSSESGGTFTVIGSGNSMWSTDNDGGRFVYKPLSGDCDLIAAVQKLSRDDLSQFARTGLMLRESNDRAREYAGFMRQRGTNDGATIRQITRLSYGVNPVGNSGISYTNEFARMRLIRRGDTFSAYVATGTVDTVWTPISSRNLALGETLNAGVFVNVHSSSALNLMTNEFKELSARVIVDVQTNASDGAEIVWLTDLPYLPTNTCQYAYSVTRTELDGSATVLATDLSAALYSDNTLTKGVHYRYSVTATEVPYEPQAVTGTVHVGTSGTFRYQAADTNLVSGIASGLTMAYYDTKTSTAPYAISNATSLAAILNPTGGETTDFKTVVDACLSVDATDLYTFFLELDDSAEIFIDGKIILRNWDYGGDRWTASAPVRLEKGRAHAFRALFYQASGGRKFNLRWNRAGDPDTVADVPGSAFTPVPAGFMTTAIGDMKLNGNTVFDAANDTITIVAGGGPARESTDSGRAVLTATGTSVDQHRHHDALRDRVRRRNLG